MLFLHLLELFLILAQFLKLFDQTLILFFQLTSNTFHLAIKVRKALLKFLDIVLVVAILALQRFQLLVLDAALALHLLREGKGLLHLTLSIFQSLVICATIVVFLLLRRDLRINLFLFAILTAAHW